MSGVKEWVGFSAYGVSLWLLAGAAMVAHLFAPTLGVMPYLAASFFGFGVASVLVGMVLLVRD